MGRWLAIAILIGLAPTPLAAADDGGAGSQLKEVERALEMKRRESSELLQKSADIDKDINRLRLESVAAAKTIQEHEGKIYWLEDRLAELSLKEKEKSARLGLSRGRFSTVLAALERLARRPPEALFVQPLSPTETVRSAILLRAAVPMIEQRARRLRLELAELSRARSETTQRRIELASAVDGLTHQRARMDGLLVSKANLKRWTESERRKATERTLALADQAKSLRDLLKRLESDRRKRALKKPVPPPQAASRPKKDDIRAAPISKARGTLPYPVVGRLTGHYGQASGSGLTSKGITIETRAGAQVVAPFEGQVVFAGQFRGYGRLLIIEHSEGYHSLLSGLGRIDGAIGHRVLGGEPVGVMGSKDDGKPTLYVELRRNGRPINPLPWLAANKGKVSG